jgi:hypothetical protein
MLNIQDPWQIIAACIIYSNMHENQKMHQLLFKLLIICAGSYMFWHYIAILREHS